MTVIGTKVSHPRFGDVYWADLRPVNGSEQDGDRPVFVASNNAMNVANKVIIAIPLTRRSHENPPINFSYDPNDLIIDKGSVSVLKSKGYNFDQGADRPIFLCGQARAISVERLIGKVGNFKSGIYDEKVKEAISYLFALDGCIKCHYPIKKDQLKCGNPNCKTVHNKKCKKCNNVMNYNYRYCPSCGKGDQ